MTCERSAELLLEADVAELRGEVPGPLAGHLADCERCRRRARRILDEHERLEHALDTIEHGYVFGRRRRHWLPGARRTAALLLPAAAAVIGAVFIARSLGEPRPAIDAAALYAALHPPRPLFESDDDARAAVITTDERVTLVLLYQGDR